MTSVGKRPPSPFFAMAKGIRPAAVQSAVAMTYRDTLTFSSSLSFLGGIAKTGYLNDPKMGSGFRSLAIGSGAFDSVESLKRAAIATRHPLVDMVRALDEGRIKWQRETMPDRLRLSPFSAHLATSARKGFVPPSSSMTAQLPTLAESSARLWAGLDASTVLHALHTIRTSDYVISGGLRLAEVTIAAGEELDEDLLWTRAAVWDMVAEFYKAVRWTHECTAAVIGAVTWSEMGPEHRAVWIVGLILFTCAMIAPRVGQPPERDG